MINIYYIVTNNDEITNFIKSLSSVVNNTKNFSSDYKVHVIHDNTFNPSDILDKEFPNLTYKNASFYDDKTELLNNKQYYYLLIPKMIRKGDMEHHLFLGTNTKVLKNFDEIDNILCNQDKALGLVIDELDLSVRNSLILFNFRSYSKYLYETFNGFIHDLSNFNINKLFSNKDFINILPSEWSYIPNKLELKDDELYIKII